MLQCQAYIPICAAQLTPPALSLPSFETMSVRVLVVALVVQILLASAFIVWAASGFPLP
jgi:hypothetical protein